MANLETRTRGVLSKPDRLLTEGRVHVPDVRRVVIEGDTGIREVRWIRGAWECTCPGYEYRRTCSHIDAVRAITQPTLSLKGPRPSES